MFWNTNIVSYVIYIPEVWHYIHQGNYVTRDISGMCHLMPQQHLPEWREEEEQAFVHHGSWIPNKGLETTLCQQLSTVFTWSHYKVMDDSLKWSVADSDAIASSWDLNCHSVFKCPLLLLPLLTDASVAHATAILSGIISLRGYCTYQKISMFCALSPNNQHLFEKYHMDLIKNVQGAQKWHWNFSRPSGF